MFIRVKYKGLDWVQCICDSCATIAHDKKTGFDLMPDELVITELVKENGWDIRDDKHYCPKCIDRGDI